MENFKDIIEEIEMGIREYSTYMIPKGAISEKQKELLSERYWIEEEYFDNEMIENIDEVDIDEKINWTTKWHYSFMRHCEHCKVCPTVEALIQREKK